MSSTRIIDLHCYPNTKEWIECQQPYVDGLAKNGSHPWVAKTEDAVVKDFSDAGVQAVLVALDLETTIGTPPCSNDFVSAMQKRHPGRIIQSWGAVDPLKGEAAIVEARRAIQEALGMIDIGTTGMGASRPGGMGGKLRHAHPLAIDDLAADFPDLTIIAAHPGWPWVEEMTAVAMHKGNVYWELSGWAPKYFPQQLKVDIRSRLKDKIMFGSDYPSVPYDRVFRDWHELGYADEIYERIFHQNAERVLGL